MGPAGCIFSVPLSLSPALRGLLLLVLFAHHPIDGDIVGPALAVQLQDLSNELGGLASLVEEDLVRPDRLEAR
jgi:hypothetical protein